MSAPERGPVDAGAATVRTLVDRAAAEGQSRTFLLGPERRDEIIYAKLQLNALGTYHALQGLGIPQRAKVSFMLDNGRWSA